MPPVAHVVGPVVDGKQSCTRCRAVIHVVSSTAPIRPVLREGAIYEVSGDRWSIIARADVKQWCHSR